MKSLVSFAALSLVAGSAFATPVLECIPANPCLYGEAGDLGYCVRRIEISATGEGEGLMRVARDRFPFEVLLLDLEVLGFLESDAQRLSFYSSEGTDGDNLEGEFLADLSRQPEGSWRGSVTIEEDFPFDDVTCREK